MIGPAGVYEHGPPAVQASDSKVTAGGPAAATAIVRLLVAESACGRVGDGSSALPGSRPSPRSSVG